MSRESWKHYGSLHREDGPAQRFYRPDGSLERDVFYLYGKITRRGGPAVIRYAEDGRRVLSEEWKLRDDRHRADGPATVNYDEAGNPKSLFYAFEGQGGSTVGALVKILRSHTPVFVRSEFLRSSYAPLIEEGVEVGRILDVIEGGVMTVDGIREVLGGAPIEWVRSWESGSTR